MESQTVNKPNKSDWASRARSQRFRLGAVIVLAVAVGLILWLALRDSDNTAQTAAPASSASQGQLENLAAAVNHPVFWLGPRSGTTYEVTRTSNGSIYVRYLPQGVSVGAKEPYLTVATYPFGGAFEAIQAVAKTSGVKRLRLAHGGIAEVGQKDKTSVHAAFPGVDYQVEVFDPTPGTAEALLRAGGLTAIGNLGSKSATPESGSASPPNTTPGTEPVAMSPAQLKSFANSIGQPIYWAGTSHGKTYEVTRTASGQIYVRYLPKGVPVGSRQAYPSVATYPFPAAFAAIQAVSKQAGEVTMDVPGGGLAVYDRSHPKSIHLAFPDSDYQIEVFDPSPAQARELVAAGLVAPIS